MIVSLLRHKTSVEILHFKLRSQFKTCLLRHKNNTEVTLKNSGVVKLIQNLATNTSYSMQ